MARTPQERVAKCFEMSATARSIIRQSLQAAGLADDELGSAFLTRLTVPIFRGPCSKLVASVKGKEARTSPPAGTRLRVTLSLSGRVVLIGVFTRAPHGV